MSTTTLCEYQKATYLHGKSKEEEPPPTQERWLSASEHGQSLSNACRMDDAGHIEGAKDVINDSTSITVVHQGRQSVMDGSGGLELLVSLSAFATEVLREVPPCRHQATEHAHRSGESFPGLAWSVLAWSGFTLADRGIEEVMFLGIDLATRGRKAPQRTVPASR